MKPLNITGHTLIEALLALLIISGAWLALERVSQHIVASTYLHADRIVNLFQQKSLNETTIITCYSTKLIACIE